MFCLRRAHLGWSERRPAQGLMEYGLILALVSLFAVVALTLFGLSFATLLSNTTSLASLINP